MGSRASSSSPPADSTDSTPAAVGFACALASPVPPLPSSSGKKYYTFTTSNQTRGKEPFIVCGHEVARAHFGGTWIGKGPAPKGFPGLEEALAHLLKSTGRTEARILTAYP